MVVCLHTQAPVLSWGGPIITLHYSNVSHLAQSLALNTMKAAFFSYTLIQEKMKHLHNSTSLVTYYQFGPN